MREIFPISCLTKVTFYFRKRFCCQRKLSATFYNTLSFRSSLLLGDRICPQIPKKKALDCADIYQMGHNKSGIYEIWPVNRVTEGKLLKVYCDMETSGGGWTVSSSFDITNFLSEWSYNPTH